MAAPVNEHLNLCRHFSRTTPTVIRLKKRRENACEERKSLRRRSSAGCGIQLCRDRWTKVNRDESSVNRISQSATDVMVHDTTVYSTTTKLQPNSFATGFDEKCWNSSVNRTNYSLLVRWVSVQMLYCFCFVLYLLFFLGCSTLPLRSSSGLRTKEFAAFALGICWMLYCQMFSFKVSLFSF